MQAQDYAMAKWAIGSRCDATEAAIEEAINSAQIIRTHILTTNLAFCFGRRYLLDFGSIRTTSSER